MTHAQDGRHAAAPAEVPSGTAPESDVDGLPPVTEPAPSVKIKRTRVSGTWVAVVVAILVLILLLIFILQNLDSATVHFFGMSGSMPLAVAMLFSAIAGALLVALVGGARILQLRGETRKARKALR
ncbi:MAG: hypothetical protein JWQ81_2130 [Amycolatopsis sp.]|jgi:uncharacterized integral membrane protein|uniref:LapA family protein n=1 Tax=Amycolatopsis sp. TaxID=37632 RepID=UPI0026367F4E|nr:LapA family protein [Amycolatopsis sp.]MCU1681391.1 hypothetical protein [Amycolatopsis sp.]